MFEKWNIDWHRLDSNRGLNESKNRKDLEKKVPILASKWHGKIGLSVVSNVCFQRWMSEIAPWKLVHETFELYRKQ